MPQAHAKKELTPGQKILADITARRDAVEKVATDANVSSDIALIAMALSTAAKDDVAEAKAIAKALPLLNPSTVQAFIPDFIYSPDATLHQQAVAAVRGLKFNATDAENIVNAAAHIHNGGTSRNYTAPKR